MASMVGTVTDASGAAVPGATVTLVNNSTGAKYTVTANAIGFYRFANIPPGQGYEATFTAKGFAAFKVTNIYLTVDSIRTQNATLAVGTQVSTVQVTAANSEVTIDTTSASVGNTFDVQQLNNLPVQQRNDPLALFAMQPGATDTGAVTGSRVDQNFVTVDGLDVNNFANGGADQSNTNGGISTQLGTIVGHAPVDSVDEFKANVAGTDAASGFGGGGQFALVTKSGTNKFHGDLNEYHRDASLVANPWFSNNAVPIVPRAHYIQNQFGGQIGGPVRLPHFNGKDKLFFLFDLNDSRIINNVVQSRVVPSPSLRAGAITYCTNAACDTTNTLSMAEVSTFDPAGKGVDQNWLNYIATRFPKYNNSAGGDGLNSLGYTFTAPNNNNEIDYVGRGDWTINDKMRLFAKFNVARQDAINQPNQFPGDPITSPYTDRSYAFVIGYDWTISPTKTNHLFVGDVVDKEAFPISYNPTGNIAFTFGDGADQALTSNPYIWPGASARRIPIEQMGDNFAWVAGKHTLQFGGRLEYILAHDTTSIDYNTTEIGLGGQTLSLCGTSGDPCSNNNASLRPDDLDISSTSNKLTWDEPFAFLLGRIASVSSDYNYNAKGEQLQQLTGDQRFYKYYQTQFYGMDSWKVIPSLTINAGLTYQWYSVPYETRGLESVEQFSFQKYFLARLMQSNYGQSGPGTVPLINYMLGGKGNGASAPGLYGPQYKNFAPHLGFAWNPGFDKKLVINGSGSITYDRTVIFAIQAIQDSYSYLFQQTKGNTYGIQGDPYNSVKNDPRLNSFTTGYSELAGKSALNLTAPATPTPPYQPFTGAGCADYNYSPCGLQNGLAFNSTIDPALKVPYNIDFNFGIQRQMPWDLVFKANYVGRLGRRLLAQEDANQVLDFTDAASGQLLSQAFASIVTQTRHHVKPKNLTVQPWFEDVMFPGVGQAHGYASNTAFIASGNINGLVANGDFGDFVQALSNFAPANVGSAAQFSENTFYDSAGFSNYNALLLTLQKNMSHGIHFDFNYTWSHSIDNTSFFANSMGDTGIGGIGLVCDAIRPRECRASSDFDARHYITSDATYQLPFGRGRMLLATQPRWIDEVVGGWDVSGLTQWHTGYPWSGASSAFVASYSNDAPPIFVGNNPGAIKTVVNKHPSSGGVSSFADAALASQQFEGPVGFQIGPRNSFRGPGFFNADIGLAKNFPVSGERVNLKFRADAFNALNHPNFQNPPENAFNGYDAQDYLQKSGFGQIFFTVSPPGNNNSGARVLQLSLRLEF